MSSSVSGNTASPRTAGLGRCVQRREPLVTAQPSERALARLADRADRDVEPAGDVGIRDAAVQRVQELPLAEKNGPRQKAGVAPAKKR